MVTRWNEQTLHEYADFHRASLASRDVDPVYPVVTYLADVFEMTRDQRTWLGLLHVAYYDLGSTLLGYALSRGECGPMAGEALHLPCGTERRGHRDPAQLARHLSSLARLADSHGGLYQWLDGYRQAGNHPYPQVTEGLLRVYGNGRWATYKACELLSHLLREADDADCDWAAIEPDDMGHAHSSGPRKGLARLVDFPLTAGNGPMDVYELNRLSADLMDRLRGLPGTVAQFETTLCDFNSMKEGHYHVGHDIELMRIQLRRAETWAGKYAMSCAVTEFGKAQLMRELLDVAWYARRDTLPHNYLTERS